MKFKEGSTAESKCWYRKSALNITDKANNYVKAYAELYDEIVKGYENGTREIYVADENGPRKLTKDEELSNLDAAYKNSGWLCDNGDNQSACPWNYWWRNE